MVAIILMSDPFFNLAADDADVDHDAGISIIVGIKDESAQYVILRVLRAAELLMILSRISSMPIPDFAEQHTAFEAFQAYDIFDLLWTLSTSAVGRSILLMTGTISRLRSMPSGRWPGFALVHLVRHRQPVKRLHSAEGTELRK